MGDLDRPQQHYQCGERQTCKQPTLEHGNKTRQTQWIDQWINLVVTLALSAEFLLKPDFSSAVFYCCWCRWYVLLLRKVSFEAEVIFGIYFYFSETEEGICFEKWAACEVLA